MISSVCFILFTVAYGGGNFNAPVEDNDFGEFGLVEALRNLNTFRGEGRVEEVYRHKHCHQLSRLTIDNRDNENILWSGQVDSLRDIDCRQRCLRDEECLYFSIWVDSGKCELYKTCFFQIADGEKKIQTFKKVTGCEDGFEQTVTNIISEFPEGTLRPLTMPFEWESQAPASMVPNPNLHCDCTTQLWMTCGLLLTMGELEAAAADDRLQLEDQDILSPFYEMLITHTLTEKRLLLYNGFPEDLSVIANIRKMYFNPEYKYHNNGCFHIQQCIDGSKDGFDPIEKRPFQSGEAVYVLRVDAGFVRHKRPVICYPVNSMHRYIVPPDERWVSLRGFQDPMKRLPTYGGQSKHLLTIEEDYLMYFVFDDEALATGICPPAIRNSEAGPSGLHDAGSSNASSVSNTNQDSNAKDHVAQSIQQPIFEFWSTAAKFGMIFLIILCIFLLVCSKKERTQNQDIYFEFIDFRSHDF